MGVTGMLQGCYQGYREALCGYDKIVAGMSKVHIGVVQVCKRVLGILKGWGRCFIRVLQK